MGFVVFRAPLCEVEFVVFVVGCFFGFCVCCYVLMLPFGWFWCVVLFFLHLAVYFLSRGWGFRILNDVWFLVSSFCVVFDVLSIVVVVGGWVVAVLVVLSCGFCGFQCFFHPVVGGFIFLVCLPFLLTSCLCLFWCSGWLWCLGNGVWFGDFLAFFLSWGCCLVSYVVCLVCPVWFGTCFRFAGAGGIRGMWFWGLRCLDVYDAV